MSYTRREFLVTAAALPMAAAVKDDVLTPPTALPMAAAAKDDLVSPPVELAGVRKFIEERVARGIVPSVAVGVTRHGKPVWTEAFGFADLEAKQPATTNTIYKLASLSKPITATALMVLVDRGLVELDAPANDYLRGAKLRAHAGSASAITVRRLLDHTAGIPTHENLFFDGVPVLPRDETIRRHGFAAWPPGSRFHYSNLGTAILGFITEDVAGVPWERVLESTVFRPLEMNRSANGIPRGVEQPVAVPYDYDVASRFVRTGEHLTDHPGGSSLRSTVEDLLRFLNMHLGAGALGGVRVLSEVSARMMQTQRSVSGRGWGYGLGFSTDVVHGRRSFFHGGGGPGMGAWMRALPDDGIAFVVLTNYFGAMAQYVNKLISAAFFGQTVEPVAEAAPARPNSDRYKGTWHGTLEHHQGHVPLVLTVDTGMAVMKFGTTPGTQSLRDVAMNENEFVGTAEGILEVHAGYHGPSQLELHLRREADSLRGVCHVYAKGYYELPHWIELQRV